MLESVSRAGGCLQWCRVWAVDHNRLLLFYFQMSGHTKKIYYFIFLVCAKNGCVPYGQKVRLDGWCEGGLGQQRYDGGGCVTMRER